MKLISTGGILSVGGCSDTQQEQDLRLGRLRVVNIYESAISFQLKFVHNDGGVAQTESDTLASLGDDSKADEWVRYAVEIENPSEYDYVLDVDDGKSVAIDGNRVYSSAEKSEKLCAMLGWIVNDPINDIFSSYRMGSACGGQTKTERTENNRSRSGFS